MPQTETVERVYRTDVYYGYRYPLPSRYSSSFFAEDEAKWQVLASIGIERTSDTPLKSWRDAVADASGIERSKLDPEQGGALDLCFSETPVRQFVMYLA